MTGGGTYPNLFDAHPPFQIDGNFGATAGITEMLMQSHEGEINLLPALPDEWSMGSITGIKARGGFTLDIAWENGKLKQSKISSSLGGICRIRSKVPIKILETDFKNTSEQNINRQKKNSEIPVYKNSSQVKLQDMISPGNYSIEFKAEIGKNYTVVPL